MASYIWLWFIVILARSLSRVVSFKTDFASAAVLQDCVRASFVFRHLWWILVELLRQSPALLWNSVHRCDLTREYQKWRLQFEAADW